MFCAGRLKLPLAGGNRGAILNAHKKKVLAHSIK